RRMAGAPAARAAAPAGGGGGGGSGGGPGGGFFKRGAVQAAPPGKSSGAEGGGAGRGGGGCFCGLGSCSSRSCLVLAGVTRPPGFRCDNGGGEPGPVDHALTDWTALDLPTVGVLLPVEILDRDHLEPRRDQQRRRLPPDPSAFDDGVPRIEVITDVSRIERI